VRPEGAEEPSAVSCTALPAAGAAVVTLDARHGVTSTAAETAAAASSMPAPHSAAVQ
jgi:hypothetical protein